MQAGRIWDDDAWQTIVDDEKLHALSQTQQLCEELDRARRALAESEEELKRLRLEMGVTKTSSAQEGKEETAQDSQRRGIMSLFRLSSFTKGQLSREAAEMDKTAADGVEKDSFSNATFREWALSLDQDTEEQLENAQYRKDTSALELIKMCEALCAGMTSDLRRGPPASSSACDDLTASGTATTVGIMMKGMLIDYILMGVPASGSEQLQQGDRIVKVDGVVVTEATFAEKIIGSDVPGSAVTLTVVKDGATCETDVTIYRISRYSMATYVHMFELFSGAKTMAMKKDDRAVELLDDCILHWLSLVKYWQDERRVGKIESCLERLSRVVNIGDSGQRQDIAPARPLPCAPRQAWATDSSDDDDADEMPMVEFSTRTQQKSARPVTQRSPERTFESSSHMTANVVPDEMPLLGAHEEIFAGDATLSGESHITMPLTITKPGTYQRAIELIVLSLQQMEIEHLNDHRAVTAATAGTTIGISYDEGDRRVTAVMVGGPAFNSKRVFKGEEIVAVDGRKVIGSELMTLLKGSDKPGSAVELTLLTTAVKPAQSDCENCLLTSQIYEISDRSSLAGTNQDSKTPKNGEPCHRR